MRQYCTSVNKVSLKFNRETVNAQAVKFNVKF